MQFHDVDTSGARPFVLVIWEKRRDRSHNQRAARSLRQQQADGRDIHVVYAVFDKDQAFAWLEKALNDRSSFLPILRLEPNLDPLKNDPGGVAYCDESAFAVVT
ncbi:MAG TPA: hypothetical protein VLE19_12095 [Pyrinomonadaceae bacterium]|nr:hypothetical protein [Pyrinomonadaceae bacterium]